MGTWSSQAGSPLTCNGSRPHPHGTKAADWQTATTRTASATGPRRAGHTAWIVLVGIQLDQFALLGRAIEAALETGPDQEGWINRSDLVGHGG